MTVVLHKHQNAHGKRAVFTYICICCRKTPGHVAIGLKTRQYACLLGALHEV